MWYTGGMMSLDTASSQMTGARSIGIVTEITCCVSVLYRK